MEIDYIFPYRIFSSKKSSRVKILIEWKKALNLKNRLVFGELQFTQI